MRRSTVLACLLALSACGPNDDQRALAKRGQIDTAAPVTAEVTADIGAPVGCVWAHLSDISHWPNWQHAISAARLDGAPVPGAHFHWTQNGVDISSTIEGADPRALLAWTGTAWMLTAIHVWKFAAVANGTRVTESESIRGPFAAWIMSSDNLQAADASWLQQLKRACEGK